MTEDEMAGWHHRLDGRESECPSMGFSRREYWSGVPLPSPGLTTTVQDKIEGLAVIFQLPSPVFLLLPPFPDLHPCSSFFVAVRRRPGKDRSYARFISRLSHSPLV